VWRRLSDVTAWPTWLPTVRRVQPLDATTLSLGSRFRVVQPKLRPVVWQVVELQAGQRFAWAAASPGLSMLANHTVEPAGGGAQLDLEFRFEGMLGALVGALAGGITRRYLAVEAASLKAHAEADARGGVSASGAPAS
jgi:hypothetical protein